MIERAHALVSLESRHAEGILGGLKRVEFRRRSMNIPAGTTIWFYVKVPVGKVIGLAEVQGSHLLAPTTLWKRYGAVSGLTRTEFFDYFSGVAKGCALILERPRRLSVGVPLSELRALVDGFQPPQFFQHLAHGGPLLTAFQSGANGRDYEHPVAGAIESFDSTETVSRSCLRERGSVGRGLRRASRSCSML